MSFLSVASGIATIGSAVLGTKAALDSAGAAKDAARAQSQAAQIARRQESLRAARERRELIRSRRVAAAENLSQGVARGVVGSSALAGVQSALNTNFASNLSFLDQMAELSTERISFLDQAQQSSAAASVFSAMSSLAFTGARTAGGFFSRTPEFDKFSKALSGGS
jgi:hypothetical protein